MEQVSAASPEKHRLVEKAFGHGLALVLLLIVGSAVYFGDRRPSELQRRMHAESIALLDASGIKIEANACSFLDKRSAYYRCPIPGSSVFAVEQSLQEAGWHFAYRNSNDMAYQLGRKSVHIEAPTASQSHGSFVLIFHPR